MTDLASSPIHGQAGGHSVFYQVGLSVMAVLTQSLIPVLGEAAEESPFATGPAPIN